MGEKGGKERADKERKERPNLGIWNKSEARKKGIEESGGGQGG